jgi:hypothetical protein
MLRPVWILAAKLLLTPSIVVATTLAGRRYGPAVSGWLVALPLISGPMTLFFAVEQGRHFAARAALGSLSGTLGEAAFCLGWATAARRSPRWGVALAAGSAGFAGVGLVAEALPLSPTLPVPLLPVACCGLLALLLTLRALPSLPFEPVDEEELRPRWELPSRAIVTTGLLLLITGLAEIFGARLSGLLGVYPLYTAVLAGFAQRAHGPAAALRVLRGLLLGLFAFLAFFLSLSVLLERTSVPVAFATALVLCLAVHGASLWPLHHGSHTAAQPA